MIRDLCKEEAWQICNSYFKEALKASGLRSFPFSDLSKVKVLLGSEVKSAEPIAILIYRDLEDSIKEVDFIAAKLGFKRQGAAQKLLSSLSGELWLELKETNIEACSFYKKNGFIQVGRREAYYKDGGAALNMLRKETASLLNI